MASAKFLEEALSTDVDESAVSALVGSLETQLVSSGGGQAPSSPASHNPGTNPQPGPSLNHVNNGLPATSAGSSSAASTSSPAAVVQQQQQSSSSSSSSSSPATPPSTALAPVGPNSAPLAAGATVPVPSSPTAPNSGHKFGVANGGVATQQQALVSAAPSTTVAAMMLNATGGTSGDLGKGGLGVPASGYLNQVVTSATPTLTSQQAVTSSVKPGVETIKIVYPPGSQPISTSAINSRMGQVTTALPNGSLGMSLPLVTAATAQSVINAAVRPALVGKVPGMTTVATTMQQQQGGSGGSMATTPSLVIKSAGGAGMPAGVMSVPVGAMVPASAAAHLAQMNPAITTTSGMATAMAGMPGGATTVVTLTPKMAGGAAGGMVTASGASPTVIPAGPLQILNMNAMRPGPISTQGQVQGQGQKTLAPRVVIAPPQMVRPGQPGQITLQTLQQLQTGTQGTLLLKTENGQFQLIRVSPAPPQPPQPPQQQPPQPPQSTTTPQPPQPHQPPTTLGTAVTTTLSSPSGNASTIPGTAPYRLQSVPASSMTTSTAATSIVSHLPLGGTTTIVAPNSAAISTSTAQTATAQMTPETAKIKCKKFLANLLELSGKQPEQVARNVRNLIQGLIDGKVESEEFCNKLQKELNSQPQPCLVGFLKKSLPHLRLSLANKELSIEGIKPPPPSSVTNVLPTTSVVTPIQQNQVRSQTLPAQVRIVAPLTAASGVMSTLSRATQIMQPRVMTPVRPPVTHMPKMVTPVRQPITVPMTMVTTATQLAAAATASSIPSLSGVNSVNSAVAAAVAAAAQAQAVGGAGGGAGGVGTGLMSGVMSPAAILHAQQQMKPPLVLPPTPKQPAKDKDRKASASSASAAAAAAAAAASAGYSADDDINDVAAMGGVNLAEETQRILGSTEFVGTQIRSCKDEMFLFSGPLQNRIKEIAARHNLEEPQSEVAALISHATQERLKNLVAKLAVIAEHRLDVIKLDPRYEVTQDVKGQLKFLEELDKLEKKRHEEQEREMLLRAAKSRSKSEDPEQAKLKAKAKEMQRAEMEELRQREANLTALQAIGPRKKPRLDLAGSPGSMGQGSTSNMSGMNSLANRPQLPLRPRVKRVNLRDLLFLMEQEKETTRSTTLYRGFLK